MDRHTMGSSTEKREPNAGEGEGRVPAPKDHLLSRGFRDVDDGNVDAVARCQHCLEFISRCPQFQKVRSIAFDTLALDSSDIVGLDVGCGPGLYTTQMAKMLHAAPGIRSGQIIGVDLSSEFINAAREKHQAEHAELPLAFHVGDARELSTLSPLLLKEVSRIYVERTLQHIPRADFQGTLDQMYETLQEGGLAVVVEPNWELFTVRSADIETTRKILTHWKDNFNHAQVGMNLIAGMRQSGFTDLKIEQVPVEYFTFEQGDLVYDLTRSAQAAAEAGGITEEEAATWVQEQKSLGDDFYCSLAMCVVSGRKSQGGL